MIETLNEELLGQTYDKEGIEKACQQTKTKLQDPSLDSQVDEFGSWLSQNL